MPGNGEVLVPVGHAELFSSGYGRSVGERPVVRATGKDDDDRRVKIDVDSLDGRRLDVDGRNRDRDGRGAAALREASALLALFRRGRVMMVVRVDAGR